MRPDLRQAGEGSLSVVVPCSNVETSIDACLRAVLANPFTGEVVVVDDGSSDRTAEVVQRLADQDPRIVLHRHDVSRGKGAALRTGFRTVRMPFVLVQEADLEYDADTPDPGDYETMLEPLVDGRADVVYGSRFLGGRPHRVLRFWHTFGNRMLTLLSNAFTDLNLTDMETSQKAFRREVLLGLDLKEDRFGVEPEITAKVAAAGWRVYEVGISYAGRAQSEANEVGWRDAFRAVYCIVKYSGTTTVARQTTSS